MSGAASPAAPPASREFTEMGPIGDDIRIIQLHPSLRCNLRCAHCYSTSSPQASSSLAIDDIEGLLAEAVDEEYNAISVSGGEPLLYASLPRLLRTAQSLGYLATVTTNGIPLNARRIDAIAPYVALIAISLDGAPASHDRMRALPGAFDLMRERLPLLRAAGVPFGFIFTLTLHNLHELEQVAEFAVGEGAGLLQVHPLESVGRAQESALDPPDELELSYAFLEVARLQSLHRGRLTLQYDVVDRPRVVREPCRAYLVRQPFEAAAAIPLSHLISPVVLREDGWIVPLQHGFSRRYAIGRLGQGTFSDAAERWKRETLPDFLALARETWLEIGEAPAHLPFTNWYAAISAASYASAGAPSAVMV